MAWLQYIHGHHAIAKRGAKTKPAMAPKGADAANQANAMFRGPSEKDLPKMPSALGRVKAGPIPWKTRAKTNSTWLE
ncbi:hypothetical protein MKX07_005059 [Trichoderma sp. CBMAI-0711]|nr:hypothetical protein MKX07_005059 [Trichoderma sp. CBMAI-0711]